ncbi:ComEA family DNA-binding protein [Actinomadura logoneensis]|uniref:ComEA family DNA-binding protein n=1 Tax=Actinomadura logoneensis TaxID=2293572 RepID=UPI001314252C|nr:helix-hairpin-helix domain-containing protein [Actinomadura logoneensis]
MPPFPPPPRPSRLTGLGWAVAPLLTLGWSTPLTFMYAALRVRSAVLGGAAVGYALGIILAVHFWLSGDMDTFVLGQLVMTAVWIGGSVHAFTLRPRVFGLLEPASAANEHAVRLVRYRRTLRADARRLIAEDPALAHELHIGRPDLTRLYDDGGLVDVNHAPADVLTTLPGLTPALADRIVRHRAEHGGFVSVEELAVDVDLPPALLPKLKDYVVFLD